MTGICMCGATDCERCYPAQPRREVDPPCDLGEWRDEWAEDRAAMEYEAELKREED